MRWFWLNYLVGLFLLYDYSNRIRIVVHWISFALWNVTVKVSYDGWCVSTQTTAERQYPYECLFDDIVVCVQDNRGRFVCTLEYTDLFCFPFIYQLLTWFKNLFTSIAFMQTIRIWRKQYEYQRRRNVIGDNLVLFVESGFSPSSFCA